MGSKDRLGTWGAQEQAESEAHSTGLQKRKVTRGSVPPLHLCQWSGYTCNLFLLLFKNYSHYEVIHRGEKQVEPTSTTRLCVCLRRFPAPVPACVYRPTIASLCSTSTSAVQVYNLRESKHTSLKTGPESKPHQAKQEMQCA